MKITVNDDLALDEIGLGPHILPDKEIGFIEIGKWKRECRIRRFYTKDFHIPKDFFPHELPLELDYDWKETEDTLKLGPVIAFLVSNKIRLKGAIHSYKKYMEHYPDVRGLVFISTTKQIYEEDELMKGHYYNPISQEIDLVERSFPLADVIYKRCGSSRKGLFQRLSKKVKIFNWPNLNKLAQYNVFRNNDNLKGHFPKTIELRKMKTVDSMLQEFPTIYVKPINRAKAKGICTISKRGESYILTKETENQSMSRIELKQFLEGLKARGKYILQQAGPTIQNKNIVLRSIMQKNEKGDWTFTSGYSRIGKDGSVITNRMHTKEFLKLEESFKKYYDVSEQDANLIMDKLITICTDVCNGFDQAGLNFGDLAFDLMLDTNLHFWVIEVNNRHHNHRSPLLTIKDYEMYRRVITTPLLYAKYLSGF